MTGLCNMCAACLHGNPRLLAGNTRARVRHDNRCTHLGQTLQREVAKGRLREEPQQDVDHLRFENVAQRDPRQVGVQRAQRGPGEVGRARVVEHKETQVVDQPKLVVERRLELSGFCLRTWQ